MGRKPFTTRIDEALLDRISALCTIMDRNLNEVLEEALHDLLKKHKKDDLIEQFLKIKQKASE